MSDNHISFSQYSQYAQCPFRWKLNYIDDHNVFTDSVYTIFGKAMHTTLQTYLKTMYNSTAKEADELPLGDILNVEFIKELTLSRDESGEVPCSKQEATEFYLDGLQILEYFKKHRNFYFPKKNTELLGIELKINSMMDNNVRFTGFIDVIIKNTTTNKIRIIDIKTSTKGWNKWAKQDKIKQHQLLLYKQFYSKEYNVPMDKIDVEFFIVKRKLYENFDYPQKRVQIFKPSHGIVSINRMKKEFEKFVSEAFTEDGEYNLAHKFVKLPSKKACMWCEFKDNAELCDKKGE